MPVVSRLELENAQKDVDTIGMVVNGAADLVNPGKAVGTVTSRLGTVIKTLAKVAADGTATVEALLTPIVYETTVAMNNDKTALTLGVFKVKAGQTCYNRETTQIYILTSVTVGSTTTRTWEQVSDLAQAASAGDEELLLGRSAVGRVSVTDYYFLKEYDRFLDKNAIDTKFIKFPGKSTTGEGLIKALNGSGATQWPTGPWGQEGVDFGVPTALLGSLVAGNAHPAWTTPNRILIKPDSASKVVDGYNVLGLIEVNNAVTESVYIKNCIVDGNYAILTAVQADNVAPIHVSNCILRNFQAQAQNLNNGTVKNCLIEGSKGDGMKGDFFNGGVIYNCLVRKLGQIDPSAHADAMQCQNSNGLRVFGNTFYMPGTGTTFDEGAYGSTQCLRIITESNILKHTDMVVAGNLFIGGGYTVAVRSRFANGETSKIENVVVANNMLGGPGYHVFGHITAEHGKSTGSVGVIRNLLFHNNRDIAGTPMTYGGINQNGLWHYDKAYASPTFLELGKRWGYLDWNGDPKPGIANRTEVNQAVGTIP